MLHTMPHMVLEDLLLNPAKSRADSPNLRHDIDAVAIVLHHLGDAPHLPFDPVQPLSHLGLDVLAHAPIYTPGGYEAQFPKQEKFA